MAGRWRSTPTRRGLFETALKIPRDQKPLPRDQREPLPPDTDWPRAARELGIVWIAAHSPQAKGRVERSFQTAQDRLVKGLRMWRERRPWNKPTGIYKKSSCRGGTSI